MVVIIKSIHKKEKKEKTTRRKEKRTKIIQSRV